VLSAAEELCVKELKLRNVSLVAVATMFAPVRAAKSTMFVTDWRLKVEAPGYTNADRKGRMFFGPSSRQQSSISDGRSRAHTPVSRSKAGSRLQLSHTGRCLFVKGLFSHQSDSCAFSRLAPAHPLCSPSSCGYCGRAVNLDLDPATIK
jgi:hypothetical protein